jgi:glycosyltransferase involved in cell wall biosynthesis
MFSRIPFIYDVQDMWPDTLPQTGMMSNKRVLAMVDWWCHMLYRHSARVVVPSQGFRNLLASRGVPQAKIEVIYNWCEESAMGKDVGHPAAVTGLEGRLTILYAGNMGTGQALAPVLDAARLCARDCPSAQFVFVGDGVEKVQLEDRARTLGLDNVSFMPRQPMSAMGPILLSADVLLVHLKRHPLFHITIPSKTQAYMVAGRPILMGVLGDAADLIRESGAGLVCEPGKPEDIARAVKQFAEMPVAQRAALGEAGTRFYRDHLSMAVGIEKFDRVFEEAVALSRPRRLSGNAR